MPQLNPVSLDDLLRIVPVDKLESALTRLLGNNWQLIAISGKFALGPLSFPPADHAGTFLKVDGKHIGQLKVVGVSLQRQVATAAWLEFLLTGFYFQSRAKNLYAVLLDGNDQSLPALPVAIDASGQAPDVSENPGQPAFEQRLQQEVERIEKAQCRLYQAEKMKSVNSLASGMAHEINNPIGFITSNLATAMTYLKKIRAVLEAFHRGENEVAQKTWATSDIDFILEDFPSLLGESAAGAHRVARIVTSLQSYAGITYELMDEVDINRAVQAVTGTVAETLPKNIRLETNLQTQLPGITGDESRINQVLFSMLQNARQALDQGGGLIEISTRLSDKQILIKIRDEGCGIAPSVLSRIFDPFFTTRDVGGGMGLGLTVCHDVILAHGGHIDVKSVVGGGSTFVIYLPCIHQGLL